MSKELQAAWDRAVLKAWYSYPKAKVGDVSFHFAKDNNLSYVEFLANEEGLRRIPQRWAMKIDFRHWVLMYVRPLGLILLNTDEDDVEKRAAVLVKLSKVKLDTSKHGDIGIDPQLRKLRKEVQVSVVSHLKCRTQIDEIYDKHRLSGQWGVCK